MNVLTNHPAALAVRWRGIGSKWNGLDDHSLREFITTLGRPAAYQCHDFVICRCDQLGVAGVLLGRDAFFSDEQALLDGVEILLTIAVERDLVTRLDIKNIFENLAVAANMAGQHNVSALARIGRSAMLSDRVLCDLPDGDLLIALPSAGLHTNCCSTSQPTLTTFESTPMLGIATRVTVGLFAVGALPGTAPTSWPSDVIPEPVLSTGAVNGAGSSSAGADTATGAGRSVSPRAA